MKLLAVAGEASGDTHGGAILEELKRRIPDLQVQGIGGPRMQAAGLKSLFPLSTLQVHGLVEILRHLPRLYGILGALGRKLRADPPDAVLLIDYPGFNLKLARKAHDCGIPVIYYCSPQIWAWRRGRLRHVVRNVDKMIVLFPFEVDFYREAGVDAEFFGHPLVGIEAGDDEVRELRQSLRLPEDRPVVAVMPGSRPSELGRHLPTLLESLRLLRDGGFDASYVLPLTQGLDRQWVDAAVARCGVPVIVAPGAFLPVLKLADYAIASSGTATLQLAMAGVPSVVVYRVARLTYWLASKLSYVDHLSIVNILLRREIFPELLQNDFTPERVRDTLLEIAEDPARRKAIGQGLAEVVAMLGEAGAYARAAEQIAAYLAQIKDK